MAANEFDVLSSRPHFPGYPIFCWLSQLLLIITGNISTTFSIIGAFSVFTIIFYCDKIWLLYYEKRSLFFWIILFINPFMWLMSNRYMPDLLGLSFLVVGFYYLNRIIETNTKSDNIIFGIVLSFLFGIRVSYIPFFTPIIILMSQKNIKYLCISFIVTSIFWLTPFLYLIDIFELIDLFKNDAYGHFYRWGGTVLSSDGSVVFRFFKMLSFLAVDGFSFWSENRHWTTILNSTFIIFFLIYFFQSAQIHKKDKFKILLSCFVIYFLWALFFQNVQYKPRHLLPFIPFICFLISVGFKKFYDKYSLAYLFCFLFILTQSFITLNLIIQHKEFTAISQVHAYLQKKEKNIIVVSDELKLFYWKSHSNKSNIKYMSIEDLKRMSDSTKFFPKIQIYTTYSLSPDNYEKVDSKQFFHNPHVNRLWSELTLNIYETN